MIAFREATLKYKMSPLYLFTTTCACPNIWNCYYRALPQYVRCVWCVTVKSLLFILFVPLLQSIASIRQVCVMCDRPVKKLRSHLIKRHQFEPGTSRLKQALKDSRVCDDSPTHRYWQATALILKLLSLEYRLEWCGLPNWRKKPHAELLKCEHCVTFGARLEPAHSIHGHRVVNIQALYWVWKIQDLVLYLYTCLHYKKYIWNIPWIKGPLPNLPSLLKCIKMCFSIRFDFTKHAK